MKYIHELSMGDINNGMLMRAMNERDVAIQLNTPMVGQKEAYTVIATVPYGSKKWRASLLDLLARKDTDLVIDKVMCRGLSTLSFDGAHAISINNKLNGGAMLAVRNRLLAELKRQNPKINVTMK
jgi:hypothetical protein